MESSWSSVSQTIFPTLCFHEKQNGCSEMSIFSISCSLFWTRTENLVEWTYIVWRTSSLWCGKTRLMQLIFFWQHHDGLFDWKVHWTWQAFWNCALVACLSNISFRCNWLCESRKCNYFNYNGKFSRAVSFALIFTPKQPMWITEGLLPVLSRFRWNFLSFVSVSN